MKVLVKYLKRYSGPRIGLKRAVAAAGFEPGDVLQITARPGEIVIRVADMPREYYEAVKKQKAREKISS